ncbi:MAG TPA: lysophospholipid acyltransferase family protein [Rubrivivax sp.]|nr:1-acyl-sn-glycerol-3-phosphate acyltransferase [Burkholderiales bacterium]HNU09998.1 lysophospholipid acyltransferase family protein [Rubrivivax sp.]
MSSAEPEADLQSPSPAMPLIARSWMRPLAWVTLQALLLLLGLISIGWNLIAAVLMPLLDEERGRQVGRRGISRGYAWFWRVACGSGLLEMDAAALAPLADERGLILVANHPSLLDALLLVAKLPRAACVMKASLLANPFLGSGARLARYIDNASTHGMVRKAVADLRAGGQLVLFPEGTRTTHPPVNKVHSAVGLISRFSDAPVQVVFIETDSPYLGKGWPLWRLPPLPIAFSVRLGPRLSPPADPKGFDAVLEAHFVAGLQRPPPTSS